MKWKSLMAVLIGLLMVGTTAGGVMATSVQKGHIKPQNQVGLGSIIMTRLESRNGAIIEKHRQYIGTGAGYAWYYKVKHNGEGYLDVSVFKWIPFGGYRTVTIMPDMTTGEFSGNKFKLNSINTYSVLGKRFKVVVAEYTEWLSFGGWWDLHIKFNAGYGKHGIITFGSTEWPLLKDILDDLGVSYGASQVAKKITKFVVGGSTDSLGAIVGLLVSGINIDAAIFEEV